MCLVIWGLQLIAFWVARLKLNANYAVFFTVWPTLGLLALWEVEWFAGLPRATRVTSMLVIGCCWLPSLAWNAKHVIVPLVELHHLDRHDWETRLKSIIPDDARVSGSSSFFAFARAFGWRFSPFPILSEGKIPPGNWVLLSEHEYPVVWRVSQESLEGRPLVAQGYIYPLARGVNRVEYFLFGPVGETGQARLQNPSDAG